MAPMNFRVKVCRYFCALTGDVNNFTFEVKVTIGLKSIYPDD